MSAPFRTDEDFALELDAADPLRGFREEFLIPAGPDGKPVHYFAGNSLGLQPRLAQEHVLEELAAWADHAVEGHFQGSHPWYTAHERFRGPLSRLVGARENEVVLMNSLTVNLHLLFATFFRPTETRFRILIEDPVFPSDLYAVTTHLRHRGLDPQNALVRVGPRDGEDLVREEDLEEAIDRHAPSLVLVFLSGVSFLTGQRLDLSRLTKAAHRAGALAGYDLAHAAGNVPLCLHDWDVDFAMWCSYKYLNGGPGAPGGAFIHERHAADTKLPRLAGWWGNDPRTRFRMHLLPEFLPVPSADGWQLSNPPVLAMAPLAASLECFDEAGMERLREKSVRLTGYLEFLLRERAGDRVVVVTPPAPEARGAQLSLHLREGAREAARKLAGRGIVCDFREPDTLRAAPTPLYTGFHDVWTLAEALAG